jgi:hypothetical protein
MAFETPITGSPTVGAVEYFLASASTTATYQATDRVPQCWVGLHQMSAGDQYQFSAYEKVVGGTSRLWCQFVLTGAQAIPVVAFPIGVLTEGWEFSVKKLAGTDRQITYSIRPLS